jgi:FMN-dependent oxidoreductase (nitrilotriacetate monooxygenase family)
MSDAKRQLKLAAFFNPPGSHMSGWRLPDAVPTDMEFSEYAHVAQVAERGLIDMVFFQDSAAVPPAITLAGKDTEAAAGAAKAVRIEPMTLISALAVVTKHIGLVATGTTSYNEPFHIARRFLSIDHLSHGRAGWNLVTSQNEDEAQNFGHDQHLDHALRYERASEFHDVVVGLWESWDADAIIRDKASGRYFDPAKLHVLNHVGKHFRVRGPLNVARSPQGRPVVAQAGSSEPGKELAARTADVTFTAQTSITEAQAFYADVKARAARYGRSPDDIRILPGLNYTLGRTEAEAREKYETLLSMMTDEVAMPSIMRLAGGLDLRQFPLDGPLPDLPQSNAAHARQKMLVELARRENLSIRQLARRYATSNGHNVFVGTPKAMADLMEEWLFSRAADGFVLLSPYYPTPLQDFVELVVPELQRRGIYRTAYEGRTLRENLGLRSPAPQIRR